MTISLALKPTMSRKKIPEVTASAGNLITVAAPLMRRVSPQMHGLTNQQKTYGEYHIWVKEVFIVAVATLCRLIST